MSSSRIKLFVLQLKNHKINNSLRNGDNYSGLRFGVLIHCKKNELNIYKHTNNKIELSFEGLEAEETVNISESVNCNNCDMIVNESLEKIGYNGEEAYESSVFYLMIKVKVFIWQTV